MYYSYYYYYYYYYYYCCSYSKQIYLLTPSERSHTYMGLTNLHHLDTGPRVQPWWCYPFCAQPNDYMATQHHYLHTSWAFYEQPHSSSFVPAQDVDTHTYPWPGDANLTLKTSPGFILYPGRPGKLDEEFWRRVDSVGVLAAGITPHIFSYRRATAHSGMRILQGVDVVTAYC